MQGHNSKLIALLIIVIIIGVGAYFMFFKTPQEELAVDEFGNPTQTAVVGNDLISLLDTLQSVKFDTQLFSTPAFLYLTDFAITLQPQPQGRNNPFDIIGRGR